MQNPKMENNKKHIATINSLVCVWWGEGVVRAKQSSITGQDESTHTETHEHWKEWSQVVAEIPLMSWSNRSDQPTHKEDKKRPLGNFYIEQDS
jgi:hypothetical protein